MVLQAGNTWDQQSSIMILVKVSGFSCAWSIEICNVKQSSFFFNAEKCHLNKIVERGWEALSLHPLWEEVWGGREGNHFVLLLTISHLCPPPTLLPLASFQERSVKKNMTSYSDRYSSEDGKEGELNHPAGLIEGIWDALGVRHSSSSSFFHWCLYKQVSNAPDLVWQTFSKERLKGGWESDTPICFFFLFLSSRIRSQLTPQLLRCLCL